MDPDIVIAGLTTTITVIRDFLSGKATESALRERLEIVAERLELAKEHMVYQGELLTRTESRISELAAELDEVQAQNRALNLQVTQFSEAAKQDPFVEKSGFLFRRNTDGSWSDNVFCPNCRKALIGAFQGFACGDKKCGFASARGASTARRVLEELKALG